MEEERDQRVGHESRPGTLPFGEDAGDRIHSGILGKGHHPDLFDPDAIEDREDLDHETVG